MKFLTNTYNPKQLDAKLMLHVPYNETREQAWTLYLEWLQDKVIGDPKATKSYFEKQFRPLLVRSETEALALLLKDIQIDKVLSQKSNVELADLLLKAWAELPIMHPMAILVSEVIERLKNEHLD